MNSRASGFSLVEMLIVALLATIIMGAVYQTLTIQQRSARQIGVITGTQQTVRTAVQLLDAELREIGASANDIVSADTTSIKFRALRKVAFACTDIGGNIDVYSYGDSIAAGDTLDVYSDKGTLAMADDSIRRALVSNVSSGSTCSGVTGTPWTSMGQRAQRLVLSGIDDITGVRNGSAMRSYRTVTYGLYTKGSNQVLGRIESPPDTAVTLAGPLTSHGLTFAYFDTMNAAIAPANISANLNNISRIRITVRGLTRGAATPGGTYTDSLITDVFLRGN